MFFGQKKQEVGVRCQVRESRTRSAGPSLPQGDAESFSPLRGARAPSSGQMGEEREGAPQSKGPHSAP